MYTLNPSKSDVWARCSGSVRLYNDLKKSCEKATQVQIEGDDLHTLASMCLDDFLRGLDYVRYMDSFKPDEYHAVKPYVDNVTWICNSMRDDTGLIVDIEKTIPFSDVIECRPDCVILSPMHKTLIVVDFKTGYREVSPSTNQLKLYCGAAARKYKIEDDYKIIARVVQPRCFSASGIVRQVKYTLAELESELKMLEFKAGAALCEAPSLYPGEHCIDCGCMLQCSAFLKLSSALCEMSTYSPPVEMSNSDLAAYHTLIKRSYKLLKQQYEHSKELVKIQLEKGVAVGGYQIDKKPNGREWTVPFETIEAVGLECGVVLSKKSPITPNQALKKGIPAEIINTVSKQKFSESVKEIDMTVVRSVFGRE